jgi:DNA-binding NarL/FixJ family response regulator
MIRVVIFEDNKNLRDGLFQLINGSEGFHCVDTFSNCDRIIERIETTKPDVVLMDIEMPGISGIEAVGILKEKFPNVKVLMETIFDDDEKIFRSICMGAEGYILKHTSPVEILESIKEIYNGGSPMTPSIANRVLNMLKVKEVRFSKPEFDLTPREKEVLSWLVEGLSYKMTADNCAISIDTVNAHIKNIYKKLQVHSKTEAVAKAIKGRIV